MIRLPNTGTYSLELVTAQNGAQVVVCYSDATTNTYTGGIQTTTIVSATTTTICSTPAASTVRDVDEINIKNTFAGSHTITVQIDANATNIPVVTAALLTDESLNYTHGSGWQCKDANGNTKTTPLTAMTSAQLAAIVSDETGSGALVFSISPVLVTPSVGTPASGTLDNCTTNTEAANNNSTQLCNTAYADRLTGGTLAGAFTTLSASAGLAVTGALSATGDATIGTGQASSIARISSTSGGDGRLYFSDGTGANDYAGFVIYDHTAAVLQLGAGSSAVANISTAGFAVTGAISATTTIKTGGYTVATLPAGATGDRAYVTDATAPTYLGALTGGGAVVCPVFKNASAWISA